jgi:hypothetical protein
VQSVDERGVLVECLGDCLVRFPRAVEARPAPRPIAVGLVEVPGARLGLVVAVGVAVDEFDAAGAAGGVATAGELDAGLDGDRVAGRERGETSCTTRGTPRHRFFCNKGCRPGWRWI